VTGNISQREYNQRDGDDTTIGGSTSPSSCGEESPLLMLGQIGPTEVYHMIQFRGTFVPTPAKVRHREVYAVPDTETLAGNVPPKNLLRPDDEEIAIVPLECLSNFKEPQAR
jgi:hypothetical protein